MNKIGGKFYNIYGPEIRINHLLYVDDIAGVGNPMLIENTVENIRLLEERKKFTFSNIKSVIVKIGNKGRGYRGVDSSK